MKIARLDTFGGSSASIRGPRSLSSQDRPAPCETAAYALATSSPSRSASASASAAAQMCTEVSSWFTIL